MSGVHKVRAFPSSTFCLINKMKNRTAVKSKAIKPVMEPALQEALSDRDFVEAMNISDFTVEELAETAMKMQEHTNKLWRMVWQRRSFNHAN